MIKELRDAIAAVRKADQEAFTTGWKYGLGSDRRKAAIAALSAAEAALEGLLREQDVQAAEALDREQRDGRIGRSGWTWDASMASWELGATENLYGWLCVTPSAYGRDAHWAVYREASFGESPTVEEGTAPTVLEAMVAAEEADERLFPGRTKAWKGAAR